MSDDEMFKFDKPINWNAFDDKESKSVVIENAHVWHELGHLFAYCLTKQLKFELGNVVSIQLKSKASISVDEDPYFKSDNYFESKDCYQLSNLAYCNDPKDEKLQKKITEDINKAKAKLIVILSGGLFNIYPFVDNPKKEEFDNCYTNDSNPCIQTSYNGCAGNDWDKSRKMACCLRWSIKELENFRNSIFLLFKENKTYNWRNTNA